MSKKACLIYIKATENSVQSATEKLEAEGFDVCAEIAEIKDAEVLKTGGSEIPEKLKECIEGADVCVILFPEDESLDGSFAGIPGACSDSGSRVVGVSCGTRANTPQDIDDLADSYVHSDSPKFPDAVNGEDCWENPDRSPAPARRIDRVKCQ